MKKFSYLFILLLLISTSSCKNDEGDQMVVESEDPPNYSFFVAGHTYGNPNSFKFGMHPPFVDAVPFVNNYHNMEFGVLTGDIVPRNTVTYWDSAVATINEFNFPVHVAAGNHDRGDEFIRRFKEYYYSFSHEDDLFIILSPTRWNIENEQKEFLEKVLSEYHETVDHIFIFCHELIWWSPQNQFQNIKINYRPHYPGSSNYWSEIHPLLDSLSNEVVIFAGDLGAVPKVDHYMYYREDNVTLIASGMGGGKEDNIVIVEMRDEGLTFKLIGLNKKPLEEITRLEDYILP